MAKTLKSPTTSLKPDIQSLTAKFVKNPETERLYRLYMEEFSDLTSEGLKFYFYAARKGINFFKAYLFEEIKRRDLRIGGLCQTRKLSALGNDWEITGDNTELVGFTKANFARINISQLFSDLVEAQLQGMGVEQIFYSLVGGKWMLDSISLIPNYLVFYKDGVKFIDFDRMDIFSLRAEASSERPNIPTIDLAPEYWFDFYAFDGNEENGLLNGLIDSIIWGYFAKGYGLKDFSVYIERFAIPAIIGEFDPLMSIPDRNALWEAIQKFGNLFRAMIPNTAKITPLNDNMKESSGKLFESYLKYWNDELCIRVLGQAMTTDTSQGGSYAKALAAEYIRADIMQGDRSFIEWVMNAFIKKLIDINYANVTDYPKFSFQGNKQLDSQIKQADILVKLKQAGFDAEEEEVGEVFDFTLTRSAQPLAVGSQGQPTFAETTPKKKKKAMIEEFLLDLWASTDKGNH